MPRTRTSLTEKVLHLLDECEATNNNLPSPDEISKALGVPLDTAEGSKRYWLYKRLKQRETG